jgi:hypothetical protein
LQKARVALNPAQKEQDQDNDKNEAQSADWIVAPISAVWPCRESADKQHNKDHGKNDEEHGAPWTRGPLVLCRFPGAKYDSQTDVKQQSGKVII